MVRHYHRTTSRSSWSEKSIANALKEINDKGMSVKSAAQAYGIPRATLTRHLKKKVSVPGKKKLENFSIVFSPQTEEQLVNYLKEMQVRFFGLTRSALGSIAFQYVVSNSIKNPFNK